MIESALENFSHLIGEPSALSLLIAFISGALTSILPCSLSSLPLIILYVSGGAKDRKSALKYSITFAIGSSITFVVMGIIITAIGGMLSQAGSWYYLLLGAIMVLLSLQCFGVINIIPATNLVAKNKKRGFIGAFITGILSAIFSSPCSTPVLIALLLSLSVGSDMLYSILMLLLYSIGYSLLSVIIGTALGAVKELKKGVLPQVANIILGLLILLLALYMFYLGF